MYPAVTLGLHPPYIDSSYLQPDIAGNLKLYCPFCFCSFSSSCARGLCLPIFPGLHPSLCFRAFSSSCFSDSFFHFFQDFILLYVLGLFLLLFSDAYLPIFPGLHPSLCLRAFSSSGSKTLTSNFSRTSSFFMF